MKKHNFKIYLMTLCLLAVFLAGGCAHGLQEETDALVELQQETFNETNVVSSELAKTDVTLSEFPDYAGVPYVELYGNRPSFSEEDITEEPFECYSELDELGRCGAAYANICTELMPTEPRGEIGMIRPSGWHTVKYEGIDGNYLYNRCHLIAYMLAGENANEKNLITGTRCFNVEGMLPFENQVADYVNETDGHVLYRVTPVYEGDNLVASGVKMEAYSVEDAGEGVCFCVYVYNVQPGIEIDYATGESRIAGGEDGAESAAEPQETKQESTAESTEEMQDTREDGEDGSKTGERKQYVLNQNTGKFHDPGCSSVADIKPQNRADFEGTREELIEQGYDPCGRCKP